MDHDKFQTRRFHHALEAAKEGRLDDAKLLNGGLGSDPEIDARRKSIGALSPGIYRHRSAERQKRAEAGNQFPAQPPAPVQSTRSLVSSLSSTPPAAPQSKLPDPAQVYEDRKNNRQRIRSQLTDPAAEVGPEELMKGTARFIPGSKLRAFY